MYPPPPPRLMYHSLGTCSATAAALMLIMYMPLISIGFLIRLVGSSRFER